MDLGNYHVSWVEGEMGIDTCDDNVDVIVQFESGERYVATFFTVENLRTLLRLYRNTGECAQGLYVWSTYMLVVETLTLPNVERVVADLLATGEFVRAFEKA